MEYEKWTPTTYLFWAALMVVILVPDVAVTAVAITAFGLSLLWQLVQWIVIRRRKAEQAV